MIVKLLTEHHLEFLSLKGGCRGSSENATLLEITCTGSRTSDSLNEGLPIKMARKKFQRKRYFSYEKDSRSNSRNIGKSVYLIGQVPIKKYGLKTLFLLFNI